MSTRFVLVAMAAAMAALGCNSGGGGPTAPAASSIAGSYTGTGTLAQSGANDCDITIFGFVSQTVEGVVRVNGTTLDMDVTVIIPSDNSFAPIVCFFDGTLNGDSFSSVLRECTAPPSRGADPRAVIECPDGSRREITTERGTWSGTFRNGRHSGSLEVTFGTVDPATDTPGTSWNASRDLTLTRSQ